MPLPIIPFLGGLLRGVVASMGTGLKGAAVGALGREALRGGFGGALARVSLAGMVKGSGQALPSPALGSLIRDFSTLGKSIITLPRTFHELSQAALEAKQGLTAYSGELATAYQLLEAERRKRGIELAQRISGSGKRFTESLDRLEAAQQPWKEDWENLKNGN